MLCGACLSLAVYIYIYIYIYIVLYVDILIVIIKFLHIYCTVLEEKKTIPYQIKFPDYIMVKMLVFILVTIYTLIATK